MKAAIQQWNKKYDNLTKLQQFYFSLGFVLLVVAGLISLMNHQLGLLLLQFAQYCGGIFVVNFLVWLLFNALVVEKIPQEKAKKSTTKKAKK